jgi:hypothetical protein
MCLVLHGEEAQEGRADAGTKKAYWDVEIIHDEAKQGGR